MHSSAVMKQRKQQRIILDPKQDGITHLNIYSNGQTLLGKFLSNFSKTPFKHPDYGNFMSMEGFWHWLATGKQYDALRSLYGYEAMKVGRSLKRVDLPEFKEEIIRAIEYKIEAHPLMKLALIQNRLLLTHYFVFKSKEPGGADVIVDQPRIQWIAKGIVRLAKQWRSE